MRQILCAAAIAALALSAGKASAQSSTFDFENGTDQGFGTGFGNDASASFPVNNIGGSNRMAITQTAAFQEAGREGSNPADPFYLAMAAAAANEGGYILSYDWYIDTSATPGANGNFLQLATYVNSGSGYYAQDFPAIKDVELSGAQLASGQVFSGTVSETFTAKGFDIPAADTFFRIGFILNGDGSPIVHFDNVIITPAAVPEPGTLAAGLAMTGLAIRRRRIAK
jgi:hypothetical protein